MGWGTLMASELAIIEGSSRRDWTSHMTGMVQGEFDYQAVT